MIRNNDVLAAARAAALFTSHLSATVCHDRHQLAAAIKQAVRSHGGTRGCSAQVAYAYGEYPETAVLRMRWALRAVDLAYGEVKAKGVSQLVRS